MEIKKINIATIAAEAGKNASEFISKTKDTAVKVVDQNNDGNFDLKDITIFSDSISSSAKNTVANMKEAALAKSKQAELAQLRPIFEDDLESPDFLLSKLIRITDIDKRHAESNVCIGSIGYISDLKEMRVVNIYRDKATSFGLSYYPTLDNGMYYIDPSDRDHYIALEDYFNYLKVVRVNEMQMIAQDLGAKHFRVTYKEQSTANNEKTVKIKVGSKLFGHNQTAENGTDIHSKEISTIEIAAESVFPGHAPVEPKLKYLLREPSIQALVAMRMDTASPILHQSFSLKSSNSSGIKEKDAVKIDAALKVLKMSGNITVTSEAQTEARRFFEYEIDF